MVSGSRRSINECSVRPLSRGFTVCASNQEVELSSTEQKDVAVSGVEPFRGKAGSISFVGLTHQLVEEGKLVSAPFNESAGSLFWVLAPVALILSLVVPQFLAIAIDGFFDSELTAGMPLNAIYFLWIHFGFTSFCCYQEFVVDVFSVRVFSVILKCTSFTYI